MCQKVYLALGRQAAIPALSFATSGWRSAQSCQLHCIDCDPHTVCRTGDPLYKHWPFLLVRGEATGSCYGMLYDSMAPATFDLGCEHSNYYGRCGHRLHRVF